MSDEEKWVKAYEKLKKEGMLAPAVDYEELFAKSEFQGKKLFLFSMGTVTFPTGKIIVCDPLVYLDKNTVPYREKVPVGTFMLETLAAEMEEGNFRYIATRIRFAEEEAAYYELALTGTEDLSDWKNFDYIGFAVDAGLATVADVKVRDAYCKFESDWYEKNPEGNIYDDFFADIFAKSYEAAPRFQREGGDWINFTIPGTSYRFPMIQSGFGDGCYPVYFGYDRAGNLCRMVMEYICCEPEEEYTPEEEAYFDKNRPFLEQIAEWYVDDEPQKVIKAITSLPEEEKTDLLMGELAVAYNNTEQYEKALEILEERMDRNRENYEWHYRLGFALYYCAEEEEDVKKAENLSRRAEEEFRCALALKPSPAFKAECKEFLAWIKEDFSSYEKGIKPAKRE